MHISSNQPKQRLYKYVMKKNHIPLAEKWEWI